MVAAEVGCLCCCRACGKSSGSGYAPPKARQSTPAKDRGASFGGAEEEDESEDTPRVSGNGSGLDSFFSQMENVRS